jgi:broad specificity phosphatase PhoE
MFKKPFYFMRHGETDWNRSGVIMGQKDIPLNDQGARQAEAAQRNLQGIKLGGVFSSPLERAKQTAKIVTATINPVQQIAEITDLKECCWGLLEGDKKIDGNEAFMVDWRQGKVPEGAESFKSFSARIIAAVQECLEKSGDLPPLIVAHGGVFWILDQLLGMQSPYLMKNCQIMYVEPPVKGVMYRIVSMGIEDIERAG